ncbi:LamG-like jellyroll fold domain-containing protein, partial [Chloroflexota bacterium]
MKQMIIVLTLILALIIGISTGIASADSDDGLVAYYPFNGNANDESGNGNDGLVIGAELTEDRFGNVGSAYSFDGVNDYVEVVDSTSLDITEQISLEAWIMPSGQSRTENIVGKWGNTSWQTGTYTLNLRDGKPELELSKYGNDWVSIISPNALDLDQWYHLVGTSDGNWARLYVNGTLVDEIELPNYPYTINTNDRPVAIGAIAEADAYIRWFFYGIIDEVAIWSKALTADEVYQRYNDTSLVAYYPFNGNANDESENGNDGSVSGATLTEDILGNANSAYYFDGVNDKITTNPNVANFGANDFTVSVWFKREGNPGSGGQDLLSTRTSGSAQGWILYAGRSCISDRIVTTYISSSGTSWDIAAGSPFGVDNFPCGEWHHIALTRSENTFSQYADGSYAGGFTSSEAIYDSGLPFTIGDSAVHWAEAFKGSVDEVRIYRRALSEIEIQQLHDEYGLNIPPIVDAGPDAIIYEGDTFSGSGSFTDPDSDTWLATVDYSDGSGIQPLTLNPDETFNLSHTYANAGTYAVTVSVTDDDGDVDTDTVTVTVLTASEAIQDVIYDVG